MRSLEVLHKQDVDLGTVILVSKTKSTIHTCAPANYPNIALGAQSNWTLRAQCFAHCSLQ